MFIYYLFLQFQYVLSVDYSKHLLALSGTVTSAGTTYQTKVIRDFTAVLSLCLSVCLSVLSLSVSVCLSLCPLSLCPLSLSLSLSLHWHWWTLDQNELSSSITMQSTNQSISLLILVFLQKVQYSLDIVSNTCQKTVLTEREISCLGMHIYSQCNDIDLTKWRMGFYYHILDFICEIIILHNHF